MTHDLSFSKAHRLLIVSSDKKCRRLVRTILTSEGYTCQTSPTTSQAQSKLKRADYDLLLYEIPPNARAELELCQKIQSRYLGMGVVIIAAFDHPDMVHQILKYRFFGTIVKPVESNQAIFAVAHALQQRSLELEVNRSQKIIAALKADQQKRDRANQALDNALSVLLEKREQDKTIVGDQVANNIRKIIIPNLERLQKFRLSPRHRRMLDLIHTNLEEIASPFIKTLSSAYLDLTPNEIQVADLIKQGKRTKEIAAILNLSINTIMTHRYHIRTKLGLKNKKTHLATFLNTLS